MKGQKQRMITCKKKRKIAGQFLNRDTNRAYSDPQETCCFSYLKPVMSLFNSEVLAVKCDDTELTKKIKETILEYLNTKYRDDNVDGLLSWASTLDPRFKKRFNEDDQVIVSTISSELLSIATQEVSNSSGPSTA